MVCLDDEACRWIEANTLGPMVGGGAFAHDWE